jgi:hypothetical protein
MGVAVDLLKAFHAEQNAQTLGSELFPSVHTTLSKPPPPTPAPPGQPMHHAAGGGGSGRRSRGASPRAAPVVMRPQHSPQQQQRKAQWTDNPYELVMPAAEAESESRPAGGPTAQGGPIPWGGVLRRMRQQPKVLKPMRSLRTPMKA